MSDEYDYEKLSREFRINLVEATCKITPLEQAGLLAEYDELCAVVKGLKTRHQKEMHEAISRLLRPGPVPKISRKTYVYLVGTEDGERVKIGVSVDPKGRLGTLSTGSAQPLELLNYVVGGRSLERALQDKFEEHKVHNEWYRRCPEIETEFAKLASSEEGSSDESGPQSV
tara:strand:- start:1023 stop:1535 length:513 start_codon:yes stop_codon:yes gene_type:complete